MRRFFGEFTTTRHTEGFSPKYPKARDSKQNAESMTQERIKIASLGRLESRELKGILLLAKAKSSKNF